MSWSGIILVIVGVLLLANNFGWLPVGWLREWWPVLLIAIGIWSIARPRRGDRRPGLGDRGRERMASSDDKRMDAREGDRPS